VCWLLMAAHAAAQASEHAFFSVCVQAQDHKPRNQIVGYAQHEADPHDACGSAGQRRSH